MKKKLTIFLLIIVGITSVGWYSLNYYTDKMFDELVENMSVPSDIENPLPNNSDDVAENDSTNYSAKPEDKPISSESSTRSDEEEKQDTLQTVQNTSKETNQPVAKQNVKNQATTNNATQSQAKNTGSPESKVVVTEQEVQQKSEQVTRTDKLTAAKIILSSLTTSDIDKIREMSKGGFTANEKEKVKSMLLSRLSKEDFQVIYSMVVKYR